MRYYGCQATQKTAALSKGIDGAFIDCIESLTFFLLFERLFSHSDESMIQGSLEVMDPSEQEKIDNATSLESTRCLLSNYYLEEKEGETDGEEIIMLVNEDQLSSPLSEQWRNNENSLRFDELHAGIDESTLADPYTPEITRLKFNLDVVSKKNSDDIPSFDKQAYACDSDASASGKGVEDNMNVRKDELDHVDIEGSQNHSQSSTIVADSQPSRSPLDEKEHHKELHPGFLMCWSTSIEHREKLQTNEEILSFFSDEHEGDDEIDLGEIISQSQCLFSAIQNLDKDVQNELAKADAVLNGKGLHHSSCSSSKTLQSIGSETIKGNEKSEIYSSENGKHALSTSASVCFSDNCTNQLHTLPDDFSKNDKDVPCVIRKSISPRTGADFGEIYPNYRTNGCIKQAKKKSRLKYLISSINENVTKKYGNLFRNTANTNEPEYICKQSVGKFHESLKFNEEKSNHDQMDIQNFSLDSGRSLDNFAKSYAERHELGAPNSNTPSGIESEAAKTILCRSVSPSFGLGNNKTKVSFPYVDGNGSKESLISDIRTSKRSKYRYVSPLNKNLEMTHLKTPSAYKAQDNNKFSSIVGYVNHTFKTWTGCTTSFSHEKSDHSMRPKSKSLSTASFSCYNENPYNFTTLTPGEHYIATSLPSALKGFDTSKSPAVLIGNSSLEI